MGRKSQVDKFNARLSKKSVDEEAVNTRTYQRKQEEINKYGAEGVAELMSHGNIKEAAVVFSHEGMKAFANMFGNSMESAVVNVLDKHIGKITMSMEERMEAIVEAKMLEMMEGMTEGMRQFTAQQQPVRQDTLPVLSDEAMERIKKGLQDAVLGVQPVFEEPKPSKIPNVDVVEIDGKPWTMVTDMGKPEPKPVETPVIDWEGVAKKEEEAKKSKTPSKEKKRPIPAIADAPRPKKSEYFSDISMDGIEDLPSVKPGYRYGSGKEDIAVVAPYILGIFKKYKGIEILSQAIMSVLRKEYDLRLVNPTLTFRKVMAIDPNLENVGFGVYKYEEKTFKPTV